MSQGLARLRKLRAAKEQAAAPLANHHSLYADVAELVRDDCWSIDPDWLLTHPEQWQHFRDLDEQLSMLNEEQPEYQTTLARLIALIQDARATCEHDREGARERAVQ